MFKNQCRSPYLRFFFDGDGAGTSTGGTPPAESQNSTANTQEQQSTAETPEQIIARLTLERDRATKEAADARVSAKAKVAEDAKKDQLIKLAQALGIEVKGAEEETVESLQAKLTAEQGKSQQTEAEALKIMQGRAIDRAAWANKVDIDRAGYLEFLLSSNEEFSKLDPTSKDYQTSVTALVKGIVEKDPIFKATPGGTARSGPDSFAGAGGAETVSQEAFDKMTIQEQTKIYQTNPDLFRRLSGVA